MAQGNCGIKALADKKITEDDGKRSLAEIQKLTDDKIKKTGEISKAKEDGYSKSNNSVGVAIDPSASQVASLPNETRVHVLFRALALQSLKLLKKR
jgi:hypothetical protein